MSNQVLNMPEEAESKREITELRERVARLEVRLEEFNKRIDNLAKYARDLYDFLQKE